MPRSLVHRSTLALLLLAAASACRNGPTVPDIEGIDEDLVATWSATEPSQPFEIQTSEGPKLVRVRWSWTFRADGTYEHRRSLVTATEVSDQYVETGTWAADGDEFVIRRLADAGDDATTGPWPVTLVPQPRAGVRPVRGGYQIAGEVLNLFFPCNDTASCAPVPPLVRQP